MEAVRRRVTVQHVDFEPLTRLRIDERAGHAPTEDRLVDVGSDQLVRLWHQVAGIQVLSVDQCLSWVRTAPPLRHRGPVACRRREIHVVDARRSLWESRGPSCRCRECCSALRTPTTRAPSRRPRCPA